MSYLPSTPKEDDQSKNALHKIPHRSALCRVLLQVSQHHRGPVLHARHRRLAGRRTDANPKDTGSRKPVRPLLPASQSLIPRKRRTLVASIFAYAVTRVLPLVHDIRNVSRSKPDRGQGPVGTRGMAVMVVPSLFQRLLISFSK